MIYLNHAGTSWPKPQNVLRAVTEAINADPTSWSDLFYDSFSTVANFFHVDKSRLVLTPSCTSALNLAVMDQDWQSGDQVITSSFEHHALYRNLVKLRAQGVEIIDTPARNGSTFDLEFLHSKLKQGKTKLVAVTAACNVTGALLPYSEIVELAHHYDTKVLLDGAQIAGWFDLNLTELGVDWFTFAGHKGTQAPWGIGGLYVAENASMSCPTASCEFEPTHKKTFASKPGYCDAGSVDLVSLAGLAAGCNWLSLPENGIRLARARALATKLTDAIRQARGICIHHDYNFENKMPSIAISFESGNQKIASQLKQHQVIASAGFQCAPRAHETLGTAQHGIIRFSIGPGQTEIDVEPVLEAIIQITQNS